MAKLTQAASFYRLLKILTTDMDRDLPITIPFVFARIAASPAGIDQKELMEELGIGSSGMSRTVQTLAEVHYAKGKPGLGLIERKMDLMDNRRRMLHLTLQGERLMSKITNAMAT